MVTPEEIRKFISYPLADSWEFKHVFPADKPDHPPYVIMSVCRLSSGEFEGNLGLVRPDPEKGLSLDHVCNRLESIFRAMFPDHECTSGCFVTWHLLSEQLREPHSEEQ
jgi:hypothetical protein